MMSITSETRDTGSHAHQAVAQPAASRVVPKPIPEAQTKDPRRYQINQLRRRYSPKEGRCQDGSDSFTFKLVPSDPDFPFELAHLDCEIRVPQAYPKERPVLVVRNSDMPRGFCINIEKGWNKLFEQKPNLTLLALTRELDKHLEAFLSEQKAETVTLVSFKDARHLQSGKYDKQPDTSATQIKNDGQQNPLPSASSHISPYVPEKSYTKDEIASAKARRATEVRQIEARMGRMPPYHRSVDGIIYTLPLEPKRRAELPPGLKAVQSIHLIVPLLYPLQDLRIQLNEVESQDAEVVEDLFVEKAAAQKQMTLMSHVNFLAQNLHTLAKQADMLRKKVEEQKAALAAKAAESTHTSNDSSDNNPHDGKATKGLSKEAGGHIQVIPSPPEWVLVDEHGASGESSDSEFDSDDVDQDSGGVLVDKGKVDTSPSTQAAAATDTPERGTMISFPSVELHGIEILEVSMLSISVKCERCKTTNDMANLKPGTEKTSSCKKCGTAITACFRPQLVHEFSTRAGFLDLSGCKVVEMLPSTMKPTCAKCSAPGPGLVAIRGDSITNICRECHAKFTFRVPEVKFLLITPGSAPPPTSGPRHRQEKLGLHVGDPLPGHGACEHYRKSYRWFRFSCCSKVHPCDKCHDAVEDHINERANRMVCGWCSREQNYAVEACLYCGRSVIGRKGRGFWEGGQGTRDQRVMSRKDPRKYKKKL